LEYLLVGAELQQPVLLRVRETQRPLIQCEIAYIAEAKNPSGSVSTITMGFQVQRNRCRACESIKLRHPKRHRFDSAAEEPQQSCALTPFGPLLTSRPRNTVGRRRSGNSQIEEDLFLNADIQAMELVGFHHPAL
jgi:hypothetical protein